MTPNRIWREARLACAVACLALAPLGAVAGITVFNADPDGYTLALGSAGLAGSVVTGDLTAAAAAHGVTPSVVYGVGDSDPIAVGGVSFAGGAPGNAAGFLIDTSYRISGAFYSHQMFNGTDNTLTVTFSAPVRAFSFVSNVLNVTIPGAPGNVGITLTTSNGDVINTTTTPYYFGGEVDPPEAAPVVFNGVLSSQPFTSLTMATTAQGFNITSFAYAPAAPVPEPGTLASMLAGLAVLGFLAARRASDAD
jgi:hypothetical protein